MTDTPTSLRIGFVGLRNIGRLHLERAANVPHAIAFAAADTDAARLEKSGTDFGIPHLYTSASEMIANPEVDAVVLAVPTHLHAPLAVEALEAGKHVLVEKPIAQNLEEAQRIIAARDQAQKVAMVGMNQRFSSQIAGVQRLLREGTLGEIRYAVARMSRTTLFDAHWDRGDWFLNRELSGGGPLIDLGVHKLDLAMHLLGYPKIRSVYGCCGFGVGAEEGKRRGRTFTVEDYGTGLVQFQNGTNLHLETGYFLSDSTPLRNEVILYCAKGGIRLPHGKPPEVFLVEGEGTKPIELPVDTTASTTAVEHFARVALGLETLSPTCEQGIEVLRIVHAIYQSAETGQAVQWEVA